MDIENYWYCVKNIIFNSYTVITMCEWLYDLYLSFVAFIMSFLGPMMGMFSKSDIVEEKQENEVVNQLP